MSQWLIFFHILGALIFFYAHGASGMVALRLRTERDPGRIRAMIETYATGQTFGMLYGGLLLLLASGIIDGFIRHLWGTAWIWIALVLLVTIVVLMYAIGTRYYSLVRKAIGMEYMESGRPHPPVAPASQEALDALLARSPALFLFILGYGGLAVILWLMVFKPF
jgi:hypothetical protein